MHSAWKLAVWYIQEHLWDLYVLPSSSKNAVPDYRPWSQLIFYTLITLYYCQLNVLCEHKGLISGYAHPVTANTLRLCVIALHLYIIFFTLIPL